MRPVLIGDILCLARVLHRARPPDRPALCQRLILQAEAADKFRKRFRRVHPMWGNGSLMGRATQADAQALRHISLSDPDFCEALGVALQKLGEWRNFKASRAMPTCEIL